jgi:hypothetical protein
MRGFVVINTYIVEATSTPGTGSSSQRSSWRATPGTLLSDESIVLVAACKGWRGVGLFREHKSILTMQLPIFEDMFDSASHGPSDKGKIALTIRFVKSAIPS